MYIVGLTGGIGCGKSTISKMFSQQGRVGIVDLDLITRELQNPGKAGYVYIREAFGESIVELDGTLNRAKLRDIVFHDKAAKTKLEGIMSPLIYHNATFTINLAGHMFDYMMIDAPLLLESKIYTKLVDTILVVDCPEHIQIERVMKRSGLTEYEVEAIIATQSPQYYRLMKADDVIHNFDCLPEDNQKAVNELHWKYLAAAEAKQKNQFSSIAE
jgi:dephospho-CoA kinase